MKYDVAIIGAGPAGSTLASMLARQYKVLLVDRRRLDHDPNGAPGKCCGGLVAPDAQQAIARLGLGLPSGVLAGPQLFAVRTIDLAAGLERHYQRFYINIDRQRFDRWLVSLAPRADTRFGCQFKGFERIEGGFRIRLAAAGREWAEDASVLIGADGASSPVRRLAVPGAAHPERYVAIQEWFEDRSQSPFFSALFDRETTDFYSWTIPKDGALLLGAALRPGSDAAAKFGRLKEKLAPWGIRLGKPIRREGAMILRPTSTRQICTGAGGIALVGEAAGFISPSSCEGLSYAFRSAEALAESLLPGIEGFEARYAKSTRDLRTNILIKNIKSPFMYNSLLRHTVMKAGVSSLNVSSTWRADPHEPQ